MSENPESILDGIECPRQLCGHDLKQLIEQLQDEEHQLVLMGDWNSEYADMEDWMLDLGLVNVLKEWYGEAGPRTCVKSKNSPIDCIFASAQIAIRNGGLLSFGRLDSDHRALWIDVPNFILYGYNPPLLLSPNARRLKLTDPKVVTKYLTYLHSSMRDHNLLDRMEKVHRQAVYLLPIHVAEEFEAIDALVSKLMYEAEAQCRRLKSGTVPWSPTYKKQLTQSSIGNEENVIRKGIVVMYGI